MRPNRQARRPILGKILCIQMEQANHAIVLNISDQGLGFHAVYPVMQSGRIRFSFPQPNGQRVEAVGELIWTDSRKKTGGLRFTSLPAPAREIVRDLLAEFSPSADAAPVVSAPAPAPSRPTESQCPRENAPPQQDMSARPAPPPEPATPGPEFVLLANELPDQEYPPELETFRRRSRFFPGFVTGAIVAAIAVAFLLLGGGHTAAHLRSLWEARTGAPALAQTAPSAPPLATAIPQPAAPPAQPAAPGPPVAAVPPPTQSASSVPPPSATALPSSATQSVKDDAGSPAADNASPASGNQPLAVSTAALAPAVDSTPESRIAHFAAEPSPGARPAESDSEDSSADPGSADLALAQQYLSVKEGPDRTAAANFLWAAVQKGSVTAEVTLADLYARGDGVEKSCSQARILLQAAAEKGGSAATHDLAPIIWRNCR
jgi:PilZ domain